MSAAEQAELGQAIAGTNQFKVLAAVLTNYSAALEATGIAQNSAGSAAKENERAMQALSKRLELLKAQFKELANNIIKSGFLKAIIDTGTAILKFANSPLGQFAIKATIAKTAVDMLLKAVGKAGIGVKSVFTYLTTNISEFSQAMKLGFTSTEAFALTFGTELLPMLDKFKGFITSMGGSILTIIAVGVALAEIARKSQEYGRIVSETNEKISEQKDKEKDLSKQIAENEAKIEKYKSVGASDEFIKQIESETNALKAQKAVIDEEIAKLEEKQQKAALRGIQSRNVITGGGEGVGGGLGTGRVERTTQLEFAEQHIGDYLKTGDMTDELKDAIDYINQFRDSLEAAGETDIVARIDAINEALADAKENFGETSDSAIDYADDLSDLQSNFEALNNELDNIQSAYQTLASAIDEYNNSGYLSIDTLQQLLALEPQYLNMLFDENGNLVLNTEAIQQLTAAKIYDTAATQAQIVAEQARELAAQGGAVALQYLTGMENATAGSAFNAAYGIAAAIEAMEKQGRVAAGTAAALKSTIAHYEQLAASAVASIQTQTGLGNSMGYVSKQAGGAASAVDKEREALQKLQKQLQEQKSQYEKAYKYITRVIDDEIDKLKEQKKAEEEYWDEKIDALKEQNDALDEQAELEERLRNLAEARSRKVLIYSAEEGFHYAEDVEAVTEAQKELDDYLRERSYKEEIEKLEELKEATLKAIDDQIDGWEKYKEKWEDAVNAYDEEQERLAAIQLFGADVEAKILDQRLDVVEQFKNGYVATLEELARVTAQLAADINASLESIGSGGGGGGGTPDTPTNSGSTQSHADTVYSAALAAKGGDARAGQYLAQGAARGDTMATYGLQAVQGDNRAGAYLAQASKRYADGTESAIGGLSMVGERGRELRVLSRGDGIIPNHLTENLMKLGQYSPREWINNMTSKLVDKGSSVIQQFGDITLPNVTNAQQFVNELKQFKRYATQAQSRR